MDTFPRHSSTFCTPLRMQHLLFSPHNKRFILFWPEWQSAKSLLTMKQPRWQPVLSSGWHAAKGVSVLTEVSKGKGKKKKKCTACWVLAFITFFFFPGRQGPACRQLSHNSAPCKQEMGLQSVNLLERSCTCRRRPCFANNPDCV